MRRTLVAVLAAVALTVAGCGDDDPESDAGDDATTTTAAAAAGGATTVGNQQAKLASLVLVASDFPAGWTGAAADDTDGDDEADKEFAACTGGAGDEATVAELSSQDFTKEQDEISSEVSLVKDDASYAKDVSALRSGKFETCLKDLLNKEISKDLGDAKATIDLSNLAVAQHGDFSLGRRLTVTIVNDSATLKLYADFVFMGKKRFEVSGAFLGFGQPVADSLRTSLIGKLGKRLDAA